MSCRSLIQLEMTTPLSSTNDSLSAFRDSDGLPVPSTHQRRSPMSSKTRHQSPSLRKSSRDVARRAAQGNVSARLDRWSIDEVEKSLDKIRLRDDDISLLSWLRTPTGNKAEVIREILERMSNHAEEHAIAMALVWRFAKEQEVWKSCPEPELRTENSFLDSIPGQQTIPICIQFGT